VHRTLADIVVGGRRLFRAHGKGERSMGSPTRELCVTFLAAMVIHITSSDDMRAEFEVYKRHVTPKRQLTFNSKHGNASQKTELFDMLAVHVVHACSWLGHYCTSRKVSGSIPDEVNEYFSIYLIIS
jgi:hypothetical protein